MISNRNDSRNSPGSDVSFCQSSSCRSQAMSLTGSVSPPERPVVCAADGSSLYFQCAATPNSARRCMVWLRIWISTGLPSGPITVVCKDWYMLNLGIAM